MIVRTLSAPDGVEQTETTALVDWNALEIQFRGKTRFVTGLAEKALKNYRLGVVQLRSLAAGEGDCAEIAFLAHSIKGTAGSLKALRVHALAARTDMAARAAEPGCRALAEELAELLDRLIAELEVRVGG